MASSPEPDPDGTPLSARNHRVARLRRLLRRRRERELDRTFVLEGPTLLDEAIAAGVMPTEVHTVAGGPALPATVMSALDTAGVALFALESSVFASIASTDHPRPVLAAVPFVDVELDRALAPARGVALVVIAHGVAEPGNLGTIVRSAAAAGATAVVTTTGSVDLYNPKCVRATAGALFHLPVVRDADPDRLVAALRERGIASYGLAAESSVPYDEVDLTAPVAIVAGNEAHGLDGMLRGGLDGSVSIPMACGIESLNVAGATTVVAFEAARQRRASGTDSPPSSRSTGSLASDRPRHLEP